MEMKSDKTSGAETANRHTAGDLKQMQSLPLSAKILMTKRRIREWYEYFEGDVYVSFSGGKDSTVLKHIVDSMYSDVPAVFVNTGLEYPEIQRFVKDVKAGKWDCFNPDVEILCPEMRFDEVIKKYGYPVFSKEVARYIEYGRKAIKRGDEHMIDRYLYGKRKNPKTGEEYIHMPLSKTAIDFTLNSGIPASAECCSIMKKKPADKYAKETGRKSITGTMAAESRLRERNWMKFGCNAFDAKHQSSQPLSFWTEQDVLHYIKQFNVPYCPVYGEIRVKQPEGTDEGQINVIDYLGCYESEDTLETTGCSRTGCMFCMFGCHLEKEPNRFQRMKVTHPKQYAYCMEKLGLKQVLEYIGVPYD